MASMLYSLVRVVLDAIATSLWGTQSPSSSMSHSQKVTEQRKARTGYDLRPS
jgi:hypothetical protein